MWLARSDYSRLVPIYDDRVTNSGIWAHIEGIVALTEALPDDLPAAELEQVQRLRSVVLHFQRLLRRVDAEFLTPTTLNSLAQHVGNSSSELGQYLSSRNPAHLANVDSYVDAALAVAPFAYAGEGDEADGYAERLSSFRRSAGQHLAYLEREVSRVQDSMNGLSVNVAEEVSGVDQRVAAVSASAESVAAQLRAAEERAALLGGSLQQTVEADRQRWESEIQADIAARRNDFAQAAAEVVAGLEAKVTASEEAVVAALARIAELETEASTTVATIGGIALVGDYAKYASEQKSEADRWRTWTIVLGIAAAVATAGALVWTAVSDEIRWDLVVTKLALTLAIGGSAAYCSSQSAAHRERERQARHVEVELASLPSYVRQLDDQAVDVLKEVALRRFGHGAPAKSKGSDDATTKSLIDALVQALTIAGPR